MSIDDPNADSSFESDDQQTSDQLAERVAILESRLATVENEMLDTEPEPGVPQDDGTVVCPTCGYRSRVLIGQNQCQQCGTHITLKWRDDDE